MIQEQDKSMLERAFAASVFSQILTPICLQTQTIARLAAMHVVMTAVSHRLQKQLQGLQNVQGK